jgi:hypothetical protein
MVTMLKGSVHEKGKAALLLMLRMGQKAAIQDLF